MKYFDKIFNSAKKSITSMKVNKIYKCSIASKDISLTDKYTPLKTPSVATELERVFYKAIDSIHINFYASESEIRKHILMHIAKDLGYFSFAAEDGIYISTLLKNDADISSDYSQLNSLFVNTFGVSIELNEEYTDDCYSKLYAYINSTHDFYVKSHGEWIMNFMNCLGDDISRDSFASFLRQRILVSIFYNSPTLYPYTPPTSTSLWRQMRENMKYDFPKLNGASKNALESFYRDTFVYEQYGISGIVEAENGDVVIDAGAFIGDTTCYFSRKVGTNGKVFAFEIVPQSASFAEQNMKINSCENVTIVPYALSDKIGSIAINIHKYAASASSIINDHDSNNIESIEIQTVTLDEWCGKITPNFIKADIEGSEMAMLQGGANTISHHAPTCAICLYHKRDDFWQIPQKLQELCPDYKFWFRCEAEPVLFAKRGK